MSVALSDWKPRDYFAALKDRRVDPTVVCTALEDLTRQADAPACDINAIVRAQMKQFGRVLEAPEQLYADVSAGWDYRETLERAQEARDFFLQMPSNVREYYGNDPGRLFDAFLDPAEVPVLQELGILKRDPVEVPDVPVAPSA